MKKPTRKLSAKATPKSHRVSRINKETIRLSNVDPSVSFIQERLKFNLDKMIERMSYKKITEKYQAIAHLLSSTARLNNGRVWTWNYVASVHKKQYMPGKKFIQALNLCVQNSRCKQWFYFTCRRNVAAIYNKTIMQEIITTNMQNMGYKPVTFSKYMEVKRKAVRS